MMKKMLIVVFAFVSISLLTVNAEEEVITRETYIKQIIQLIGSGSELPKNPTALDYATLLNEKGFDVSTENLNAPITAEEKSSLINKIINYKLENREKAPEGIVNKAIVDEVSGEVSVLVEGKEQWLKAEKGMELGIGDTIKTGVASYIYLRVGKFGRITIRENSELTLKELSYLPERDTENIILNLAMGETIVDAKDIKKGTRFEVRTPTTIAAVRGTIYSVKIIDGGKMTRCE